MRKICEEWDERTVVATLERPSESLSQFIWRTHYRDAEAVPCERSMADSWDRVARSVAALERDPSRWQRSFRSLLEGFRFRTGRARFSPAPGSRAG
ncbi:hypothetical protein B2A_10836 [mine drainage metagenome]|uniref:Uncharacterized protein n=1 Tax=mine drainage metagenome TaxID=410659 RepID=T0Z7Q1_9ZZZZ